VSLNAHPSVDITTLDNLVKVLSRNKDRVEPANLAFTIDLPVALIWDLMHILMAIYVIWVFAWVKSRRPFWPFLKLVPFFLILYVILRVSGSVLHHRVHPEGYLYNNAALFLANDTVLCGVFFAVMVNKLSFRGQKTCGIPAAACTLILYFIFLAVKMFLYGMYLFFLKNTGESPMNLINVCYFIIIFLYILITYLSNGDKDLRLFLINLLTLPLIQSLIKLRELCYLCTPDALADMAIFYIHSHSFWWESLKESVKKNPNPTTNIRLMRIFDPRLLVYALVSTPILLETARMILYVWRNGDIYVTVFCLLFCLNIIWWIYIYFFKK